VNSGFGPRESVWKARGNWRECNGFFYRGFPMVFGVKGSMVWISELRTEEA
jgi:hypothetical protein